MTIKFNVYTKMYENKTTGMKFPIYLVKDNKNEFYQLRATKKCGQISTPLKAFILTTDTKSVSKCVKTRNDNGTEYKTNILYIDGYSKIEEMPKEEFDGSDFE